MFDKDEARKKFQELHPEIFINKPKIRVFHPQSLQIDKKFSIGYLSQRKNQIKYPEKHKARKIVFVATRNGSLKKLPCEKCGEIKSEAHHDDYSKPLEVRWLCKKHHTEHHVLYGYK